MSTVKLYDDINMEMALGYTKSMLKQSIFAINEVMANENYAQQNPVLVAAYLQTTANVYNTFKTTS